MHPRVEFNLLHTSKRPLGLMALASLLLLSGCAALVSGHYPTDLQKRIDTLPSGQKMLVIPLLGNQFWIFTKGFTIFNNSNKMRTVDWAVNREIAQAVQKNIAVSHKFIVLTPSKDTIRRLQDQLSHGMPKRSDLLELAHRHGATLLLTITHPGPYPSYPGYSFDQNHLAFTGLGYGKFYVSITMKLYHVPSGEEIVSTEESMSSKRFRKYWPRDPNKWTGTTLSLAEKEIKRLLPKVIHNALLTMGFIPYPKS
jgi:hypothetical protein